MGEITLLLERSRSGDSAAWEQAVSLLYDDLLQIARRATFSRGPTTLNATALVHECYLRVARSRHKAIADSGHFLAIASRAMRQIMVNHARDRVTAKRGGGAIHVTLTQQQISVDQEANEVLLLEAALLQLAKEDEQLSRIVDCRIFGGLTEEETANALEISLRTVQRRWQQAREKLRTSIATD